MLKDLGIATDTAGSRVLEVWNKIDRLEPDQRETLENAAQRLGSKPALVSAITGEGIPDLLADIETRLGHADEILEVTLPATAGRLAHWLHENAEVLSRDQQDDGSTHYTIRVDATRKARLEARLREL